MGGNYEGGTREQNLNYVRVEKISEGKKETLIEYDRLIQGIESKFGVFESSSEKKGPEKWQLTWKNKLVQEAEIEIILLKLGGV